MGLIDLIKKRKEYKKAQKKNKARSILNNTHTLSDQNEQQNKLIIKFNIPEFYKIGIIGFIKHLWKADIFIGKIPILKSLLFINLFYILIITYILIRL